MLCLNQGMLPVLYPILDATFLPADRPPREERLRSLIEELLSSGVTLLQYRNKTGTEAEVLVDALVLREAVLRGRCALILNDYPELAVEAGFDGVHVGQQDMAPEGARAILGNGILGVSTHNPEQLAAADLTSADYLAIGPVFATSSKQNPDPVVGLDGVRLARGLTKKPLVAIGGITLENCKAVLDAGADSVAVISSLFADASERPPGKIASDFFLKLR
jgi:thiamine-phosphate pyrophosphorylase